MDAPGAPEEIVGDSADPTRRPEWTDSSHPGSGRVAAPVGMPPVAFAAAHAAHLGGGSSLIERHGHPYAADTEVPRD